MEQINREQVLSNLQELKSLLDEIEYKFNTKYLYHMNAANELWYRLQMREGKYRNDSVAESWQRIVHEHYLQAAAIWSLFSDDEPVGMNYKPTGLVKMTGKAS